MLSRRGAGEGNCPRLHLVEAAFGITVTEVTWRKPSDFFKCVGEIMWISVADVIANLGDGVICFAKLGLGVLHLGL